MGHANRPEDDPLLDMDSLTTCCVVSSMVQFSQRTNILYLKPPPSTQRLKRDAVRYRMPIVERKERKSEYM